MKCIYKTTENYAVKKNNSVWPKTKVRKRGAFCKRLIYSVAPQIRKLLPALTSTNYQGTNKHANKQTCRGTNQPTIQHKLSGYQRTNIHTYRGTNQPASQPPATHLHRHSTSNIFHCIMFLISVMLLLLNVCW